jgi:hypothetical protein
LSTTLSGRIDAESTSLEERIRHMERNFARSEHMTNTFDMIQENMKLLQADLTVLRDEIRADNREMRTAMTNFTYEMAHLYKTTEETRNRVHRSHEATAPSTS